MYDTDFAFYMSSLVYRSVVFLKFEYGQITIYAHIFFLYLDDGGFFT